MNKNWYRCFMLICVLACISVSGLSAEGFSDDHSDGSLTGWSVYGSREWSESEGRVSPANNSSETGFLINGYECSDNGYIEVEINADQWNGDNGGVVFRWNDINNYYYAAVKPGSEGDSYIKFCRNTTDETQGTTIASDIVINTSFTLKIEINGSSFRFYIDGEYKGEVTDTENSSGQVGYGYSSDWNDYIDFESISWTDEISDNTPPEDIVMSDTVITEGKPVGSIVGSFTTTDQDPEDTHSYSLVSGEGDQDNASFSVEGDLLKTGEVFDYNVKNRYSIRVRTTEDRDQGAYYEERFTVLVDQEEDYQDWLYSKSVYLNTTESGADITGESVYEFPLLIRLNSSNFNFSEAEGNGSDLRFSDENGNHIPFDIEEWDSVSQTAYVWVRVPEIRANTANDSIVMYWGKADAVSRERPAEVFALDNHYIGAYHLEDIQDATGMNEMLNNGADRNSGYISGGFRFDSGDYLDMSEVSDDMDMSKGSFSCWIKMDDSITENSSNAGIIEAGDLNNTSRGIYLRKTSGNELSMVYRVNSKDYAGTASDISGLSSEWRLLSGTYDSDSVRLFIDGVLTDKSYRGSGDDITSGGINRVFTGKGAIEGSFAGIVDEVRIAKSQRSEEWIKLCYENQKRSQSMVSFYPVEGEINSPSGFRGYAQGNNIRLEWRDNSDNETGFEISYGSSPDNLQTLTTVDANSESYVHYTGYCDISYYYGIRAYNSESQSNMVVLENKAYSSPCIPEYLAAAGISETEIEITWAGDSYMYELYSRDTSTGEWQEVYKGGDRYYLHSGLGCNRYMEYRVRAVTPDGVYSDFSDVATAETGYCPLSPPSEIGIDTSCPEEITVTWIDNSDNEEGFRVYRREGESGEFTAAGFDLPEDSCSYTDKNLLCDTKYYYYVTSFNSSTESSPSDTAGGTTLFCGADKATSGMLSVPGMYLDSLGNPVNGLYSADIKIYGNIEGTGSPLYQESFHDVEVKNGYFVLNPGLTGDVASVVRSDSSLYVDVYFQGESIYDEGPRPLTASPYSIKNSYNLSGTKLPENDGVSAPVGAFYVYMDSDNSRLYIKYGTSDTDWIEVR